MKQLGQLRHTNVLKVGMQDLILIFIQLERKLALHKSEKS